MANKGGLAAGIFSGYTKGRAYRDTNRRANETLDIYKAREARSQLEADRMTAAMEHFKFRTTRDGEGGPAKAQDIWDFKADDPKYDHLKKPKTLPNSPIGNDPSLDAFHQGVLDRGMTEYDALPGGEGGPPIEEPAAPGGPGEQAGPGGRGGGAVLQGAPATQGAIEVQPVTQSSNVESTAWNTIGRRAEGGPYAAMGGPVSVGGMGGGMGGGMEGMGGGMGGGMEGTGGWMDRLRTNRANFSQMQGANPAFTGRVGYDPGNTTQSQNSGIPMQLRGAPPPMGAIQIPGQPQGMIQPQMVGVQPQPWGRAGFAEGGAVEVPAGQPQALPQGQPPQGQLPQGQPPQGQPPQQSPAQPWKPRNDYRARLAAWQHEGENMWMMAGGLEGVQKFRNMSDAAARKEVMGYGMQAVEMLDQGNIGEAMRAGNSALESTPFDTGLKFIAREGKLYMVGKDEVPGAALSANELRAYMETHLKTPEKYLEWKKQNEVERSGRATEKLRGREASVSERKISLDEKYRGPETDAKTLTALAAYENSQASRDRAARMAAEAAKGGWDEKDRLAIERDSQDWVLDNFDPLHKDIGEYFKDNPIAWVDFKNDVLELQLYNPWIKESQSGSVGREAAAVISQLLRQPGGVSEKEIGLKKGDFQISEHPDAPGQLIANYKGQLVALPKVMHADARKHSAYLDAPTTPAVDDGNKQAPAPTPPPDIKATTPAATPAALPTHVAEAPAGELASELVGRAGSGIMSWLKGGFDEEEGRFVSGAERKELALEALQASSN